MSGTATGSLPSEKLAAPHVEILEVPAPVAPADEERSYATAKKWSDRKSVLFVCVMSFVLWALIILGVRQII